MKGYFFSKRISHINVVFLLQNKAKTFGLRGSIPGNQTFSLSLGHIQFTQIEQTEINRDFKINVPMRCIVLGNAVY